MSNGTDALEETARALIEPQQGLYLGLLLVGFILDTVCLGMATHQTMHFFRYNRTEAWQTMVIIFAAFFGGAAVTFYTWAFIMDVLAYNFGFFGPLLHVKWFSWYGIFDLTPMIAVQLFYAERAYRSSGNSKILAFAIGVLLLASAGGLVASPIMLRSLDTTVDSASLGVKITMYLWSGTGALANVLITGTTLFALLRSKGAQASRKRLGQIFALASIIAETSMPPTILSILFIILFRGQMRAFISFFVGRLLSKSYLVTCLWAVNSRMDLHALLTHSADPTKVLDATAQSYSMRPMNGPTVIHVETETYVKADEAGLSVAPPTTKLQPRRATKRPSTADSEDDYGMDLKAVLGETGSSVSPSVEGLDYLDSPSTNALVAGPGDNGGHAPTVHLS
ncbi:hypothetical protein IAT38_006860 [Cryptococcus sp. DSM 104549]